MALTRGGAQPGRAVGAATAQHARAAWRSGAGGRRRREAGPERPGGNAHGKEEETASLTGGGTDQERRRRGVTTSRGGGGPWRSPAALQEGREGRVRAKIGGGGG